MRAVSLCMLLVLSLASYAAQKRPLGVADAIETRRAMTDALSNAIFVSPDRRQYAVMLIRGDIEKNGDWADIFVGGLTSLEEAARPKRVARLFTSALGSAGGVGFGQAQLVLSRLNPPVWFGDGQRMALLWNDRNGIRQVISVDAGTGEVTYLTNQSTDVMSFALGPRGIILYSAAIAVDKEKSAQLWRSGFAVRNIDALSLLGGAASGEGINERVLHHERYLLVPGVGTRKVHDTMGETINRFSLLWNFSPQFSAQGRAVLVESTVSELSEDWAAYREDRFSRLFRAARAGDIDARRRILQVSVVDVESGVSRPLWNVPIARSGAPINAVWAPDGKTVVVGPTFLPVREADAAGLEGHAFAEIDVATQRFLQIHLPPGVGEIRQVRWLSQTEIELRDVNETTVHAKKVAGQWSVAEGAAVQSVADHSATPIHAEMREDLNSPPVLFAVDKSKGEERLIMDLNPQLRSTFSLGRVEYVSWKGNETTVSGLLYYPVAYQPNRRYPLVVQAHGRIILHAFSLYGQAGGIPALGPSIGPYAAQALANQGIMVLQLEERAQAPAVTPNEATRHMAEYETAISHLVSMGLVDRSRVGLLGHSRTGWHVEYALTHSSFPYAAAVASDNMDAGYMQMALIGWTGEFADVNGAEPIGEGLQAWLDRSPGFNAEKVQAPLQLQRSNAGAPGILAAWEMFARLRHLNKPVELYVIPDIEHGAHTLQNPAQCLAAQQRVVDWFAFWLKGEEPGGLEKAEQYAGWRRMRARRGKEKLQDDVSLISQ